MRKELVLIFILGVVIVIASFIFKDNKNKASNSSEETTSDIVEETDEDSESTNFNSKKIPDDFAYVEYMRNFLSAEAVAVESGDTTFLDIFIEDKSSFEADEEKRISELSKENTINSIDFIELEKVLESDDENIIKFYTIVTINSEKKRIYTELINKDEMYYIQKMKILNLDGKTEIDLG